jgi:vesicular inhibitory amino acid transporter
MGFFSFVLMFCPLWLISYLSSVGFVALAGTIVSVLVTGYSMPAWPESSDYTVFDPSSFSELVGIAMVCFVAHCEIPSIYMPMRNKDAYPAVVTSSFTVSILVYIFVGAAGYLFFANMVQEDVLENVGRDAQFQPIEGLGFLPVFAAAAFALKLQLSFPLFTTPLLAAIEDGMGCSGNVPSALKFAWRLLFMAGITGIAILLQDYMAELVNLTGSLFATQTALILPCVFYMKLYGNSVTRVHKAALTGIVLLGVYFAVMGTFASMRSIVGSQDRS